MKKRIAFLALSLILAFGFSGCGAKESASGQRYDEVFNSLDAFPAFTGKDFDGNTADESIFADNTVTLVNFWFNECSPCVEEMPVLQELHETLQEKGGAVVGINVGTLDGNEEVIAAAKEIMEKQGASYQNIYFDTNSEAGKFATSIMTFPTTILLDKNGSIIGEPIIGGLNSESVAAVQERADAIIAEK